MCIGSVHDMYNRLESLHEQTTCNFYRKTTPPLGPRPISLPQYLHTCTSYPGYILVQCTEQLITGTLKVEGFLYVDEKKGANHQR